MSIVTHYQSGFILPKRTQTTIIYTFRSPYFLLLAPSEQRSSGAPRGRRIIAQGSRDHAAARYFCAGAVQEAAAWREECPQRQKNHAKNCNQPLHELPWSS